MSVRPLTPVALLAGVSDSSCSGPDGTCDDGLALGLLALRLLLPVLPEDCADACVIATQTPATRRRTITPPIAVIRPRRCVSEDNGDSLARRHCPASRSGRW